MLSLSKNVENCTPILSSCYKKKENPYAAYLFVIQRNAALLPPFSLLLLQIERTILPKTNENPKRNHELNLHVFGKCSSFVELLRLRI
ncbi:hypothetical protein GCM10008931_05260 [Oceanobacillus oncorhynchi subsp. oncorhynchi]